MAFVAIGGRFTQSRARLSHQLKNHLAAILQRQMAVFWWPRSDLNRDITPHEDATLTDYDTGPLLAEDDGIEPSTLLRCWRQFSRLFASH